MAKGGKFSCVSVKFTEKKLIRVFMSQFGSASNITEAMIR